MHQPRETNPHFQPRVQRYAQPHDPDGPDARATQVPQRYGQPHDPDGPNVRATPVPQRYGQPHDPDGTNVRATKVPQRFKRSPPPESPTPVVPLLPHSQPSSSHLPISSPEPGSRPGRVSGSESGLVPALVPPRGPPHRQTSPTTHNGTFVSHYPSPPIHVPPPRKTTRLAWLIAICCVLFWVIIIVGGLILLIVYLAYRPKYPKFDITSATLNGAYLDLGYLLNGDMTILANFTNPNKKVNVEFRYIVINIYFEGTLIAARYVEPLGVSRKGYALRDVHMVSSQIPFSRTHVAHLNEQMRIGRIMFEAKSFLRTTSTLGGFFRYSYWLYGHCKFVVGSPPSGTLVAKSCVTKR